MEKALIIYSIYILSFLVMNFISIKKAWKLKDNDANF